MLDTLERSNPSELGLAAEEPVFNRAWFGRARTAQLRAEFAAAEPFPHLVIDHLFRDSLLDLVVAEFDQMRFGDWVRYDSANEVKRGTRPAVELGPAAQAYVDAIHRAAFLGFLGEVTGIGGLIPDPTLKGGGLHEIPSGGRFGVHIDFEKHPVTLLDNRLVLITYLNKDWDPAWGGALELWSDRENRCVKQVEPLFGRTILFAHSSRSLHGHPEPIRAPEGRARRSIAAYFYTNGRPEGESDGRLSTRFHAPLTYGRWGRTMAGVKYLTPPALVQLAKWTRRKLRQR